jgi:hypothetical protein
MEKSSNDKNQMSNQIQNPNVKTACSPVQAEFELMGGHIFFSICHLTFI